MQSFETLSNRQIAEILDNADVIETWLKAVREYACKHIDDGNEIPGWTLKAKRGTRKWKDERIVMQRLASEGLENFVTETLASPAQVEKLAKKQGVQLDLFDLVVSESSGTKLVREDAAGSATTASDDFAD